PMVAAVLGGMNPQHVIVNGLGAAPNDSVGYPWNARYTIASGNLLADFRYNVTAESQGRLQVCRLYEMTTDRGVRDMLSFLIARDTMHQNQWLAAIEELKADDLEETPVPSAFPENLQLSEVAYQFINTSRVFESQEGRWASGTSIDGKGEFQYVGEPEPMGEEVRELTDANPLSLGTAKKPLHVTPPGLTAEQQRLAADCAPRRATRRGRSLPGSRLTRVRPGGPLP